MDREKLTKFAGFNEIVEVVHGLQSIPFVIAYTDPKDGDLLPINNDDNYARALAIARPLMRLLVQKKGMFVLFCVKMFVTGKYDSYPTIVLASIECARLQLIL